MFCVYIDPTSPTIPVIDYGLVADVDPLDYVIGTVRGFAMDQDTRIRTIIDKNLLSSQASK